jgi:uncharacterized protein (UPF0332 family)
MNENVENLLQMSKDCLEDAQILFEKQRYEGTSNRAYYAYFDAVRALLATKEFWGKSHSGTHSKYAETFVKTGILPIHTSKNLRIIFEFRQGGDYDSNIEITETDAKYCLEETQKFIIIAENYLKTQGFL